MTTLREAAQQALEALEGWDNYGKWVWPESALEQAKRNTTEALTALRAALAQEQANPPGCDHCNHPLYAATKCRVCGRVTEQAELAQEPVAWLYEAGTDRTLHWYKPPLHGTPLYTAPPQRKPLMEGALMGVYIDFDRAADPAWSKAEYLLHFARAIERAHGIGEKK